MTADAAKAGQFSIEITSPTDAFVKEIKALRQLQPDASVTGAGATAKLTLDNSGNSLNEIQQLSLAALPATVSKIKLSIGGSVSQEITIATADATTAANIEAIRRQLPSTEVSR